MLMDVFAGITVTFPSKAALEKMRKSREFLNGLSDEKAAFSLSLLSANIEHQLLSAVLEEHHVDGKPRPPDCVRLKPRLPLEHSAPGGL